MPMLTDGPEDSPSRVLLAHGAGAPMDSPFMQEMAQGLARQGIRVTRFEFDYMAARRETGRRPGPERMPALQASYRAAVEAAGGAAGLVIGGKSMGGRVASTLADALGVAGLLCLGYPFHPVGKADRLRVSHLLALRTPTLILQGSRDTMGTREEIAGYELPASIDVQYLEDGDHSFKPRKRSGRTQPQAMQEAIATAAEFTLGLASTRGRSG